MGPLTSMRLQKSMILESPICLPYDERVLLAMGSRQYLVNALIELLSPSERIDQFVTKGGIVEGLKSHSSFEWVCTSLSEALNESKKAHDRFSGHTDALKSALDANVAAIVQRIRYPDSPMLFYSLNGSPISHAMQLIMAMSVLPDFLSLLDKSADAESRAFILSAYKAKMAGKSFFYTTRAPKSWEFSGRVEELLIFIFDKLPGLAELCIIYYRRDDEILRHKIIETIINSESTFSRVVLLHANSIPDLSSVLHFNESGLTFKLRGVLEPHSAIMLNNTWFRITSDRVSLFNALSSGSRSPVILIYFLKSGTLRPFDHGCSITPWFELFNVVEPELLEFSADFRNIDSTSDRKQNELAVVNAFIRLVSPRVNLLSKLQHRLSSTASSRIYHFYSTNIEQLVHYGCLSLTDSSEYLLVNLCHCDRGASELDPPLLINEGSNVFELKATLQQDVFGSWLHFLEGCNWVTTLNGSVSPIQAGIIDAQTRFLLYVKSASSRDVQAELSIAKVELLQIIKNAKSRLWWVKYIIGTNQALCKLNAMEIIQRHITNECLSEADVQLLRIRELKTMVQTVRVYSTGEKIPGRLTIINEDANCFLNAATQILLHLPRFEELILKPLWESGSALFPPLNRLFVSKRLGDRNVDVTDLRSALGYILYDFRREESPLQIFIDQIPSLETLSETIPINRDLELDWDEYKPFVFIDLGPFGRRSTVDDIPTITITLSNKPSQTFKAIAVLQDSGGHMWARLLYPKGDEWVEFDDNVERSITRENLVDANTRLFIYTTEELSKEKIVHDALPVASRNNNRYSALVRRSIQSAICIGILAVLAKLVVFQLSRQIDL